MDRNHLQRGSDIHGGRYHRLWGRQTEQNNLFHQERSQNRAVFRVSHIETTFSGDSTGCVWRDVQNQLWTQLASNGVTASIARWTGWEKIFGGTRMEAKPESRGRSWACRRRGGRLAAAGIAQHRVDDTCGSKPFDDSKKRRHAEPSLRSTQRGPYQSCGKSLTLTLTLTLIVIGGPRRIDRESIWCGEQPS